MQLIRYCQVLFPCSLLRQKAQQWIRVSKLDFVNVISSKKRDIRLRQTNLYNGMQLMDIFFFFKHISSRTTNELLYKYMGKQYLGIPNYKKLYNDKR